jgi:hypothetical protein
MAGSACFPGMRTYYFGRGGVFELKPQQLDSLIGGSVHHLYEGLFAPRIVTDSLTPDYRDRGCCSCLARLRRNLRVLARIFLRATSLRVNTSS